MAFSSLKLDLALFAPDFRLTHRFALNLGRLNESASSLKQFDLLQTNCNDIGSMLLNDAVECLVGGKPVAGCFSYFVTRSAISVPLQR